MGGASTRASGAAERNLGSRLRLDMARFGEPVPKHHVLRYHGSMADAAGNAAISAGGAGCQWAEFWIPEFV